MSSGISKIMQEVKALKESEREELRRMLNEQAAPKANPGSVDAVRGAMVADGLVSHVATRRKDLSRFRGWQPVAIKGKPLSETIIEERR
jgi:hypothetical protein